MKYQIISKVFLISIIIIINFLNIKYLKNLFLYKNNYSSINNFYTHPIKLQFDSSNLNLSNNNHQKLLLYLKEQSKLLSSMVNTINTKNVKISQNIVNEKCSHNLIIKKAKTYMADIVVIPLIKKLNEKKFKIKICEEKYKSLHPSIALFQINNSFDIGNYILTYNDRYLLRLEILKHLMDCLGLTNTFMENARKPKNNFFQTPKYLLNNSRSFKSLLKLYDLSGKDIPKTHISNDGLFYSEFWDNYTIIKDFRSEIINIENDMSETSFELLNDMDYYILTKCDLEYDDYGFCHRIDQKCITHEEFNSKYYLRYGISNFKIYCYYSDRDNIANSQCGNNYGFLLPEIINYSPLCKKYSVEKLKIGDYDIPELFDAYNQTLKLLVPSEKCNNRFPRTIFFINNSSKYPIKNNSFNIKDISLKEDKRKFFVTFQTYEENYIKPQLLFILYSNSLIRSYVQLGNHNLFMASFPEYVLKERGKDNHRINKYQKVSFHIGNDIYSKKNLLYTIYKAQNKLFPKEYNFMEETYLYPEDKKIINKKFKNYKLDKNNLWLVKPKDGNTGKGIHIFKSLENESKEYLLTKYINNLHLIDGKKYDLRIYVLVTGLKPLRIYLNKEGLVRISAEKFSLNEDKLENKFIHLTNTGINTNSNKYIYAKDFYSENANKWCLYTYQKYIQKQKVDYNLIWHKIRDIVIKTVISGHPYLVGKLNEFKLNDTSFFNLYGYDIILDDKYEPHLLEVNKRPDMFIYDKMDKIVKENLFVDTLNIVGIVPFSHEDKVEIIDNVFNYKNRVEEGADYGYCELSRPRGNFELIFPLKKNIDVYKKFFKIKVPENEKLWEKIKDEK
jgi:hypothetical protein